MDPAAEKISATLPNGAKTPAESIHTETTSNGHHYFQNAGKRIRYFFRPDGRKVVVSSNPDERERLRRMYSNLEMEGDAGFDIVIHGDEEHVSGDISVRIG